MLKCASFNGFCNTVIIQARVYIVSKNISFPKSITARQQFSLNPGANVNIARTGRYIPVSMTTAQTVSFPSPSSSRFRRRPLSRRQCPYARVRVR